MNRYWEREVLGFFVVYKMRKFLVGNSTLIRLEDMDDSIYNATIQPMSAWGIWESHMDEYNKEFGEGVITMEKAYKKIIIKTENMFN